jgi:diguanylate cyclase (GGDEF)-like protein
MTSRSEVLLFSIISLTEQRDQLSLEVSLFQACQEIFRPETLAALEWRTDEGSFHVIHENPLSGAIPETVMAAARRMAFDLQHLGDGAGGEYLLLRIEAMAENTHRVLALGKRKWNAAERRMAEGMLRVYQNFVRVLKDSEKDTLTGLMNRRRLEQDLAGRLDASREGRRGKDQLCRDYLAVLDIDHFKAVNDTFGHLIGDEVLLTFANVVRRSLRDGDRCYRYGGEEFVVLLRELRRDQIETVLERLRGQVANHVFPQAMHITVSIGYSRIDGQAFPAEIVEEADRALYYAKNHGRDQVRDFQALLRAGEVDRSDATGSVELF